MSTLIFSFNMARPSSRGFLRYGWDRYCCRAGAGRVLGERGPHDEARAAAPPRLYLKGAAKQLSTLLNTEKPERLSSSGWVVEDSVYVKTSAIIFDGGGDRAFVGDETDTDVVRLSVSQDVVRRLLHNAEQGGLNRRRQTPAP